MSTMKLKTPSELLAEGTAAVPAAARAWPIKVVAKSFNATYRSFLYAHLEGRLATIWINGRLYVTAREVARVEKEGLPRKNAAAKARAAAIK
jgi:hypothetical protein